MLSRKITQFFFTRNNLFCINNEVDKIDNIGNIIKGSKHSEEFQFTSLIQQSGNHTSVNKRNIALQMALNKFENV